MASAKTIVLITGANQGIGLETSKRLATDHKDYQIIMAGRRQTAVEEAVQKLRDAGLANVEPLILDIASDESIAQAVQEVDKRYGHLDVLVNNAAISNYEGSPSNSRAEWQGLFNINVFGTAVVTDCFLPLLKKSTKTKRIVFVSSSLGSLALKADPAAHATHPNIARAWVYTTSKAALNMLVLHHVVAFENDKENWKINACCPGYCATNLNGNSGSDTAESGSVILARLATLGPDGPTGTFSNQHGPIKW